MSEVVNLRLARKRNARERSESEAAARRAKFGAPAALRHAETARLEAAARKLEAHRLDPSGSGRPNDEE